MKSKPKAITLRRFVQDEYAHHATANLKPKTNGEYARILRALVLPEFGDRLLASLTTAGIERWHLTLRKDTPVQANRALAVLSAVLQLAARWGYIPSNPARGIPIYKEKAKERYASREEVARLLDVIGRRGSNISATEGAFLLVALYTGARPGELVGVKWEQFSGTTFELPDSKTGRRTVFLPQAALSAMMALESATSGPIFQNVDPTLLWRKVCRKAKLEGLRLYDLRHTFASAALSGGLSLEVISQLLGHTNPKTTRRYTHLVKQTGSDAVEWAAGVLNAVG